MAPTESFSIHCAVTKMWCDITLGGMFTFISHKQPHLGTLHTAAVSTRQPLSQLQSIRLAYFFQLVYSVRPESDLSIPLLYNIRYVILIYAAPRRRI